MRKIIPFIFLFVLSALFTNAQNIDKVENNLALQLVNANKVAINISADELNKAIVSNTYEDRSTGIRYVYMQQSYKGLPVYNQMLVLAFKNGKLVSKAGSFLVNMEGLSNGVAATPAILPADAVRTSIADAKVRVPAIIMPLSTLESGKKYNFGKLNIATENITAELMWVPVDDGKNITVVKLAWQVQLYLDKESDYLHVRVDANSNTVVNKNNLTVYENTGQFNTGQNIINMPAFMKPANAGQQRTFTNTNGASTDAGKTSSQVLSPSLVGTANYTVIPYPAESPIHPGGTAAVRTNPWTLAGGNAVSLGWHNDGAADYIYSRGNNVYAQEDRDNNNNTFGLPATSTTSPDPLNFTYAGQPDYTVDPTTALFQQFAITNLFYWNNIAHDVTYNYGFTEPAGNFQNNNQGRGGAGADYVIADAQDAGGTNNANMSTPGDGSRPRMQMYLWNPVRGVTTMNVNAPGTIAGPYTAVEGAFSTTNLLANVGPVTAQVVWYNDDAAGNTHYACNAPNNSVTGKIALISRGFGGAVCTATVPFTTKVKNAQLAGAVAVIMVNNVPGAPIVMGGGPDNTIIIPAVMISDVDGATIAAELANNVNVTLSGTPGGTIQLDGDIDNGIVTHEFFHGVSNRLTGGPANSGCLGNAEEGGEGWSDYFALMTTTNWTTALPGDGVNKPRPMGNYAYGLPITGAGIRLYPYCTNISVNPLTYANMGVAPVGTEVHNIGEIWCMSLWEMTWQIIQSAGISSNFFDASQTGGNVVAFKLVMEGLKLQPCSPGYIDARNAILQADVNLYGGAHTCAIWTAFAKRGMGFSALQGSSNSATDQTAAFDLPPACLVAAPEVTINQAAAQADPTSVSPINFTVVFDQAVTGFITGDVTLSGTAGATTGTVTGSGTTYNVAVTGMTSSGAVIATIAAGVCTNASAMPNNASTSTDNTVTFNLVTTADLSITKTDGVATYTPGGTTTYTIVATNPGPDPVTGATVADVFPAAITTANWTAVYAGGATGPASGSGNINALVNIPAGGTATFTAVCNISAAAVGNLINTATITAPAGVTDPNPANNTATDTDTQLGGGPVTVTATAGTPGPTAYATVKLAFDAINAGTHQGDIIVNVNTNTVETAQAVLERTGTGAAIYTSVYMRPTGDGLTVTGNFTSSVIKLNTATNVTIDGDNPNTAGTNRNLSIINTSTTTPGIVWIGGNSGAAANNVVLKNCILTNGASTSSGVVVSLATTLGTAGYFNNVTIQNNSISNSYIANYNIAVVAAGNGSGLLVTGNDLNTSGATQNRLVGIYVQGISGATISNNNVGNMTNTLDAANLTGIWFATSTTNSTISGNTISNISGSAGAPRGIALSSGGTNNNNNVSGNIISGLSTASSGTVTGIYYFSTSSGTNIQNNKISNIKNTNAVGWGSNGIWLASTAAAAVNAVVYNNFISDVASQGFTGRTVSDNGYGIAITTGRGYNLYYNTVLMNTNQANNGYPAALLVNTVSTNNTLDIRDNIFVNTQTVGTDRYCVQSAATAARYLDINYNDYYTAGPNLGYIGNTNRADLAAWQTGTGKDANSLSAPVQFVSATNLHLTAGNCLVDGKGTPITVPAITTDIDADVRDAVTPDMGADEFTAAPPPTVNQPANQAVCVGSNTAAVNFTGTATTYTWINNAPAIGLAASGTGNIASFVAQNPSTTTALVATITVTPVNGACPGTPVSFTITVNPNPSLVILADPGTTVCEGDPTLLTVYNGSGFNAVNLTQSSSLTITPGSVSCNAGGLHTDNSYWRAYNLAPLGLPSALTVNTVTFGVEQASGGAQPVTVNLYTQTTGTFPGGTRTLVGTQAASVPDQALSLFTVTFGTPVVVPSNAVLIVELFTPNGQTTGRSFFIGSNAAAQTGTSYLSAADCGVATPTDVATIGFPNMHIILNVGGTTLSTGGIATGSFLWTPAAGLSSTTTNPVAASPMATTTYTVTRTTVPGGCVASANITITVNKRPVVTANPVSRVNCSGTTATFTVGATGTALTYQWQVSPTGVGGPWTNLTNTPPYTGVNTAVLTVNPATLLQNGYAYRCVLSGTCAPGIPPLNISSAAVLTVNPLPNVSITPIGPVCGGVAGINGTQLTVGSAPPPVPGQASASSGTISVIIPDGTGVAATSNLTIAGVPANATITEVKINMNINHTWVGDVDVNIKAPNAAILNLVGGLDGGAGGNSTDNFTNTTFSSLGGATISGAPAPRTATFAAEARPGFGPTGYIQTVTAWGVGGLIPAATNANGVWTLAMGDFAGGDQGTLTNWSISIDYTTPGGGGGPTLTYVWSPLAGLYTNTIATTAYTGTNTPTVYAAPTAQTTYTVTATDVATGCTGTASVVVNYTPPAPNITPSPVVMCLGDPAVRLTSSTSSAGSCTTASGAISVAVPDGSATGAISTLAVSCVPAGATVTGVSVNFSMPAHTYVGDMTFNLKAPNGTILNLDKNMSGTGTQAGAYPNSGFVNAVISSAGSTALGSAATTPITGTWKADLRNGVVTPGYTISDPTGYVSTATAWNQLYSVPNGTWTLAMADDGAGDVGTLTSWSITINYVLGVPASPAVWTPNGVGSGLFTDPAALNAYLGTPTDTVYTRPTPSGVYTYQATVRNVIATASTINTPMAGGNGNNLVAFNVRNNNPYAVTFASIASNTFGSGAVTSRVFYKAAAIAGNPGPISAANGWNQFGTANNTVTAGSLNQLMSGLTLSIPAGATYGIALDMSGATFPAYTNGTGAVVSYSNGGCDLITDGNVGWGGPNAPGTPANNPRNFNGQVVLLGSGPGSCTSPARTVTVTVNQPTSVAAQPVNKTVCTDKVATFSVTAAGSGPFSYQWQVSTNSGNTYSNVANGGVYSGATSATLTITAPPVSMSSYLYRCVITGAAPCAAVTSFQALLTVNPLPTIVISASPYTSLFPGLRTTLSSTVTPNAAGPGGYSWLRNGAVVSGANTGTLSVDVDGLGDYSLRVTDVNGCTNTSNTISIKDSVSARCFIYPNPTSGKFQVRYYSVANNVLPRTLTVFDAKGDRVFTQFYTVGRPYDRMDVDMRAYGKGLYWVEIGDLNGNRLTMCRVVIQ